MSLHLPLSSQPSKKVTTTWWDEQDEHKHMRNCHMAQRLCQSYLGMSITLMWSISWLHTSYIKAFISFSFICTLDLVEETDMRQAAVLDLQRNVVLIEHTVQEQKFYRKVKGQKGEGNEREVISFVPLLCNPKHSCIYFSYN